MHCHTVPLRLSRACAVPFVLWCDVKWLTEAWEIDWNDLLSIHCTGGEWLEKGFRESQSGASACRYSIPVILNSRHPNPSSGRAFDVKAY